jgi:cleavage and polyadenylation specificity factor subunit 2
MDEIVEVTPLLEEASGGGVASLLSIGRLQILLDCGCSVKGPTHLLSRLKQACAVSGRPIDAVVLSHADLHHLGALPVILGRGGFPGTKVVCTLPVHKFGQMTLYDYYLNKEMEGFGSLKKSDSNGDSSAPHWDLDDLDLAFSKTTTLKFSQNLSIASEDGASVVTLCPFQSGRTIGGSMWRLRHGVTEILYISDMNLKRETVLDGASLALLPTMPSLLIVDGLNRDAVHLIKEKGAGADGVGAGTEASAAVLRRRREKDDPSQLISTVMETVRGDGNVLIPCESASRTLELMQILGVHWATSKLGEPFLH